MPISYKNKIYTTLGTPTALSGDVVSTTNSAGVPAKDYTVKGKTIVWNQLLDKSKFTGGQTFEGITSVNNGDGSFTLSGTSTGYYQYVLLNPTSISTDSSHKYLLRGCPPGGQWGRKWGLSGLNTDESTDVGEGVIITGVTSISPIMYVWSPAGAVSNLVFKPQLFDLTKMFGTGNEPATVAEFRAMFPDDYYPYNTGELKTIVPTSVEVSTVNLLKLTGRTEVSDERDPSSIFYDVDKDVIYKGLAANGYLQSHRITEYAVSDSSVSLNGTTSVYGIGFPMKASSNTTYYIYMTGSGKYVRISYVSPEKKIIGFTDTENPIKQFTTPANCAYIIVVFLSNPTNTEIKFENICVSTVQTNEYQPYNKYRVNIPSSKYFPDGMRSAGLTYDEINFLSQKAIKRIGSVDMGTLNWGSNTGQFPSHSFYSPILADAKGGTTNIISNGKFYILYIDNDGRIIAITDSSEEYDSSEAFKAAMSGVMLYYELATPVETAITPPLQALSTYKSFTSFSAPNSLTQNGPLSVIYYAEGGANPGKGWLTSYKRKLYMGRNIEWNQLFTNSMTSSTEVTISQNQDGTMTLNGTVNRAYINFTALSDAMNQVHKYLLCLKILNNPDNVSFYYGFLNRYKMNTVAISNGESCVVCNQTETLTQIGRDTGLAGFAVGTVFNNVKIAVMVMDLTQMFGAGNEPAVPEEFWSYFNHKLYPYNPGETQPLFKISRKSQRKEK